MTFEFEEPSDEDLLNLDLFDITADHKWKPSKHQDNPEAIAIMDNIVNKGLVRNAAFAWVKLHTEDADHLVTLVNAFQAKVSYGPKYKFGIQVASVSYHAALLDRANINTLWQEAIAKALEQINAYNTFRVLENHEPIPEEYTKIPYHMIFDVKFDLGRKARLVAGGNWCDPPKEDVYWGVVSMDTVRMGFALASMNKLTVCAAYIGNTFLYGKTNEKVYVIAGKEFGIHQGKRLIIGKGLYGLRSSSARFHTKKS